MSLSSLKRTYKVQLILSYMPFIISIIISYSDVLPKCTIDYKLAVIFFLLLIPLFYSYILLLKNHIDELEVKNKLLTGSVSDSSRNINKSRHDLSPVDIHHRLASLSQKEKDYLKKFIYADSRTLKFAMDDEIVDGLRSIGILQLVSTVATFYQISYSLSPIYWDYIKKKPHVIGL